MSDKAIFWAGLMGAVATIPLLQMVATAATAPEIARTAKAITVKISEPNSQGSGVILRQQGDVYTVLTAAHVVKAKDVSYTIATPDGKEYRVSNTSIRRATVDIDLAVVEFRASTKYPTAKLGNSNSLTEGMELYVGGFPSATKAITDSVFVFREGKVSANSNKTFEKGYSLVYSNNTLPGMSGGAVLNQNGELIAIHGRGDRETTASGNTGEKTGFNLGIPISRFGAIASKLGVTLDTKIAAIPANSAPKPDDYIALGVQKFQKQDYRGALAEYNLAIQLDPNLAIAYDNRGVLKADKLGDSQGALADYNRAIQLNPDYAIAYTNRGLLKYTKLNDRSGGISDMQQAARLFKSQNNRTAYNNAMEFLKQWGASGNGGF